METNSMAPPSREFSLEGYRQLLHQFKDRSYRFIGFHELSPSGPEVILRHDIDLSLEHAVAMAELEAEESVQASYYLLVGSEFYNILSPLSRLAVNRLVELGHEVGLHFDASVCGNQSDEIEALAKFECSLLEELTGQPVRSIAFHRPAKLFQGNPDNLAGCLHSYQPRFFSEIDYCADSAGSWRYGHPVDRDSVKQGKAIQLVTHPIWWNFGPAIDTIEKVENFRQTRDEFLKGELGRNLTPYAEYLREKKA